MQVERPAQERCEDMCCGTMQADKDRDNSYSIHYNEEHVPLSMNQVSRATSPGNCFLKQASELAMAFRAFHT